MGPFPFFKRWGEAMGRGGGEGGLLLGPRYHAGVYIRVPKHYQGSSRSGVYLYTFARATNFGERKKKKKTGYCCTSTHGTPDQSGQSGRGEQRRNTIVTATMITDNGSHWLHNYLPIVETKTGGWVHHTKPS